MGTSASLRGPHSACGALAVSFHGPSNRSAGPLDVLWALQSDRRGPAVGLRALSRSAGPCSRNLGALQSVSGALNRSAGPCNRIFGALQSFCGAIGIME